MPNELHHIELELTTRELEYLTAAANEFFHKMRDSLGSGLMPDERFYIARDLWFKLEKFSKLSEWVE